MARLWQSGSQAVGEVMDALNGSADRQLAYTTVMTILVRLHEKGLVTRQKEAQVGRRELNRLIERYGAASVAGFAAALGEGDLADRLAQLARAPREGK